MKRLAYISVLIVLASNGMAEGWSDDGKGASPVPFGFDQLWREEQKAPDYIPDNPDTFYRVENPFLPANQAQEDPLNNAYQNMFLSPTGKKDIALANDSINPYSGYLSESDLYSSSSGNLFMHGSYGYATAPTVESEMEALSQKYWGIK